MLIPLLALSLTAFTFHIKYELFELVSANTKIVRYIASGIVLLLRLTFFVTISTRIVESLFSKSLAILEHQTRFIHKYMSHIFIWRAS